jgi:hypothetical protein
MLEEFVSEVVSCYFFTAESAEIAERTQNNYVFFCVLCVLRGKNDFGNRL